MNQTRKRHYTESAFPAKRKPPGSAPVLRTKNRPGFSPGRSIILLFEPAGSQLRPSEAGRRARKSSLRSPPPPFAHRMRVDRPLELPGAAIPWRGGDACPIPHSSVANDPPEPSIVKAPSWPYALKCASHPSEKDLAPELPRHPTYPGTWITQHRWIRRFRYSGGTVRALISRTSSPCSSRSFSLNCRKLFEK